MLVLSRREGEQIRLEIRPGEIVEIKVLESRGPVRLGVSAPQHIGIVRTELLAAAHEGLEMLDLAESA